MQVVFFTDAMSFFLQKHNENNLFFSAEKTNFFAEKVFRSGMDRAWYFLDRAQHAMVNINPSVE